MSRTSASILSLSLGFAATLALAGITLKKGNGRRRRIAVLLALAALACGSVATAQTAHLSGYLVPVQPPNKKNSPDYVAVDSKGNVYITNYESNNVVKETPSGSGYTETVLPFTGLNVPQGIAVDSNGVVYVADSGNARVLKLTPSGSTYTQSTVAVLASGSKPFGVAVDGSGNVYFVDTQSQTLYLETLTGGVYTQSVLANEDAGADVAVDSNGNVYFDSGSGGVWVLKPTSGGYSKTLFIGVDIPTGLAVDSNNNVYIGNRLWGSWTLPINDENEVIRVTPSGTATTIVAPSGTYPPSALAVDGNGNVYFGYADNSATGAWVVKVTQAEGNFGPVGVLSSDPPYPIMAFFTFDTGGTLGASNGLTEGSPDANPIYLDFGTGNGSCALGAVFKAGDGCTLDVSFNPWAPGPRRGAAALYDSKKNLIATAPVSGTGMGSLAGFQYFYNSPLPPQIISDAHVNYASRLAFDGVSDLFVANQADGTGNIANGSIVEFPATVSGYGTPTILATAVPNLQGLVVDGAGNLFTVSTTDANNNPGTGNVSEYVKTATGYSAPITIAGALNYPMGLAMDSAGNLIFASNQNAAGDPNSGVIGVIPWTVSGYGKPVSHAGNLSFPTDVAVDGFDNIYFTTFADRANDAGTAFVYNVAPAGAGYSVPTIVWSGISYASGIAVDPSGNLLVTSLASETPTQGGSGSLIEIVGSGVTYDSSLILTSALNFPTAPAVALAAGQGLTTGPAFSPGSILVAARSQTVYEIPRGNAPSFAFGSAPWGTTSYSSPELAYLENIGNAPLSFPIPTTGDNPNMLDNDFTVASGGSNDCPLTAAGASLAGTLAAGASCQFPIGFSPLSTGSLTGSLVLTDNSLGLAGPTFATQTIAMAGTGAPDAPVITWATPAAITYGTPLSATQLDATAPIGGKFVYSYPIGTVLPVGYQALDVTFTPTDTTDYTTAVAAVGLQVNQATPSISWATPAAIPYGTALSTTQLDAAATLGGNPVNGQYIYSPAAGTVLTAGQHTLSLTFNPNDFTDLASTTGSVQITVNQATPVINWATPAAIPYGTPLSATQLNAVAMVGTTSVPGKFVYSQPLGTILTVGKQTVNVAFTPNDTTDYATATGSVQITVNQAVPTINWSAPAPILYGTALTATQLSATATSGGNTVPGKFVYSPALGTVLVVGSQALTVTFTPTDTADFTSNTAGVSVTVQKATLTVTANNASRPYGAANPTFTSAITGFVNGDTQTTAVTGAPGFATTALPKSPVTTYTIEPTQGTLGAANYTFQFVAGTLTITKVPLTVTANSASRVYGAANPTFTAAITGFVNGDTAVKAVTGTPGFTTSATAKSPVANYSITPTAGTLASFNYTFQFAAGTLTVTKATLTVTATSASVPYNQAIPKLTYGATGYLNGDSASVLSGAPAESTTAKQGSAVGAYPITIGAGTLAAANYNFQFVNGTLTISSLGATAAPVFHPAPGTSNAAVTVTLTDATTGAVEYYTTNGTTPTTSSTKFPSAGIKVSATTTITVIAVAPGYNASAPVSAKYTIATAPTVTLTAPTLIGTTKATLNGTVTANNATTQYWFAYGASSTSLTNTTTKTGSLTGTTATAVSATVTGLTTKTKYYYQIVASNAVGTTKGTVSSFTTN